MKRLRGFTLIELLIVVAIIGILAAIAVPNFLNAQVRAKVSKAQSEMKSLVSALESFFIDNNSYPPMSRDLTLARTIYKGIDMKKVFNTIDIAHIALGTKKDRRIYLTTPIGYINNIPFDPFFGDGHEHSYEYGSDGTAYYIMTSYGPDGGEGLSGVTQGTFDERDYTGARENDMKRAGVRKGKWYLHQYKYDSSNGTNSTGDILKLQ